MARRRGIYVAAALGALVVVLALGGLFLKHRQTTSTASNQPGRSPAGRVAAQLASAWQSGNLSGVPWSGVTGAAMQKEYTTAVAGMGAVKPTVTLASVTTSGDQATASLRVTWPLAPAHPWTYLSAVTLTHPATGASSAWLVSPDGVSGASIFAPITRDARLSLARTAATRGLLTGKGGTPIVRPGRVVDVGIERSRATNVDSLVAQVAHLTGVAAGPLAKAVKAADPNAFVPVITLRQSDYAKVEDRLQPLPGTVFHTRTQSLALTRDFARALIGTTGPVTAEIVRASGNRYAAGDIVGLSGLQRQYDAQLAGSPAYTVSEVTGTGATATAEATLFKVDATPGTTLATTLDPTVQRAADKALSHLSVPGALIALDVRSGAVRAVANTPSNGLDRALVGQYQPGSTLKVATTLALLKGGLDTRTLVNCPETITVQGRTFHNFEHEHAGPVPFSSDFKNSCNTAFVGVSHRLQPTDLHDAAAQLGVGLPWAAGLGADPQTFTGSIPTTTSPVDLAAAAFGQGRNLVSPLSMAVLAGSVARGHYLAPTLVEAPASGTTSTDSPSSATTATPAAPTTTPPAAPSAASIATLHTLMRLVVTSGTAAGQFTGVSGGPIYAKTGTAEFGTKTPPDTHAWLIGWQGNIAFAAFVDTGKSGGSVAGPVVRDFLAALHAS